MRRFIFSVILIFGALSAVHGQAPELLFIRPWVAVETEPEPVAQAQPGPYPLPTAAMQKSVLEEGRVLFSAMIYGWTFRYFPGDKSRKVQESFELLPVAQIPWGSPRLSVRDSQVEEKKLWVRMSYALDEDETLRRSGWESNTAALSTGLGKGDFMKGPSSKMVSLQDAVRDAIRRGLDTRYLNKPREISGEAVLWDDPQTTTRAGFYFTTAKVKLMVREVVPYRIF
jgi:hypothetical protein